MNRGQGYEQHGEDERLDGWDPDELDNRGSEEAADVTEQQEGSKVGEKQQQVALEEGDYPEADEEAIRLEAVSTDLEPDCADMTYPDVLYRQMASPGSSALSCVQLSIVGTGAVQGYACEGSATPRGSWRALWRAHL
jgi:hypothetical protein